MPGQPRQLDASPHGWRFALHHTPPTSYVGPVKGHIVYLHPWAEEMNKSRRMAAQQACALAAAGFEVLQIDLLGCGDSSGDFADATWSAWLDDVALAVRTLRAGRPAAEAPPLWLWGLRAGALVAAAAAQRHAAEFGPCHFLFWQPTPQGKAVLQAFLRLATAGQMAQGTAGDAKALTTESLRQQLQQGHTVEIAGYALPPALALALGLDAATLTPSVTERVAPTTPTEPAPRHLLWLEASNRGTTPAEANTPPPEPTLLPASAPVLNAWREAGYTVQAQAVRGPAFWQTTEIEDAPALLSATTAAVLRASNPEHAAAAAEAEALAA